VHSGDGLLLRFLANEVAEPAHHGVDLDGRAPTVAPLRVDEAIADLDPVALPGDENEVPAREECNHGDVSGEVLRHSAMPAGVSEGVEVSRAQDGPCVSKLGRDLLGDNVDQRVCEHLSIHMSI